MIDPVAAERSTTDTLLPFNSSTPAVRSAKTFGLTLFKALTCPTLNIPLPTVMPPVNEFPAPKVMMFAALPEELTTSPPEPLMGMLISALVDEPVAVKTAGMKPMANEPAPPNVTLPVNRIEPLLIERDSLMVPVAAAPTRSALTALMADTVSAFESSTLSSNVAPPIDCTYSVSLRGRRLDLAVS